MGNKKNLKKKNKRLASNWRNIIKMRKPNNKTYCGTLDRNVHHNLNLNVDASIEVISEIQNETSLNSSLNELMEVNYDGVNETTGTESIQQVQYDVSSYNFDCDELIEVDYDEADDTEVMHKIEIEDTFYPEPEDILEIQYDHRQEILNENESIAAHLHDTDVCFQELQDKPENNDESRGDNSDENRDKSRDENRDENSNESRDENRDENSNENRDENQHDAQNSESNSPLSGRRIVDIAFLFEQMKYLNRHSEECNSQMIFAKETKLGFRSIFHFQCSDCGIFHKIQSSSKNDYTMNVNKAATVGITSIGSGFYHLEEFFAHLNIPCMSSSTFDTENKKMQDDWWKLAIFHAEQALMEEIEHAIATGNVDSAGNALIAIICDGSWGKRSYGKGFSSLSGCAAIIGVYTKKVLYFDVKNKYCDICTKSYAKFCPPNYHTCNINYYGASSGMETKIIVEGFEACERLGARFHKIISDGDSSCFKEIREKCFYRNPDVLVEKLECVNHLFRNFRTKIGALYKAIEFKPALRKLLKYSTGDDICKGVRKAATHWRQSNVDTIQKLENLEKDCLNAPYHYFGDHEKCDKYFCKKTTTVESIAIIDLLKSAGLFHEILNCCNIYFASNVKSLIEGLTNNPAEELNNVIAKYLGGKRINFSLAGSYGGRVAAAVVQYNSKGHAGSEFHKFGYIIPNNDCLKMENSRNQHYAKNEAARKVKPRKKATKDKSVAIKGYGGEGLDLTGTALEVSKNIELDKLNTNRLNRDQLVIDTYGQKLSFKWLEIRKKLVNCSYFGRIINAKSPKSYKNMVYEIVYSQSEFGNTAELRHQRLYEKEALRMFSLVHNDQVLVKTGIFIDKEMCFLGASPLRLYGTDSIVSVQCPVKVFRKTLDEAMSKKSKKWLPYFKLKDGEICVNEKSSWYAEVQGQLHITERNLAYLVVWLGSEFTIKEVTVDHSFWDTKMKEKLTFFFNEAMLKELANPRKRRNMELREYDPKTKTFI